MRRAARVELSGLVVSNCKFDNGSALIKQWAADFRFEFFLAGAAI